MSSRQNSVVIGIDPGQTCGFSIGVGEEVTSCGQERYDWFLNLLEVKLQKRMDRIVAEHFDPRRWDTESVRTIEIIGAIKYLASKYEVPYVEVMASSKGKILGTLHVTRVIGGHARDAEAVRLWDLRYGVWT